MPDISMCNATCQRSMTCRRHPDCTTPSEHWQAWFVWPDGFDTTTCDKYWKYPSKEARNAAYEAAAEELFPD